MQSKYQSAIAQICDEKNISKETVIAAIEAALAAAFRKDYGNSRQKIRAEFKEETGEIKIFKIFSVVEEVTNDEAEISLKDANKRKGSKKYKIDDIIEEETTPEGFGRIAAQTAKQVIIQRVREAEREALYNIFKDREGELVSAQVQRVEGNGAVFLDVERTTVILEKRYQIPGESFYNGQRIKVFIEKVERTEKGPSIIISRTHEHMIQRLLELEVPEVYEGTVDVKDIAREAGVRTKVSVAATEEGVDPVGSCVGQKGIRIQAVTDELSGERIDIVEWSGDQIKYLINALAPAKIISIELSDKEKLAKVYVTEDQRSLAIGKNGQNVRLASILTGWEIDIENFDVNANEEVEAATGTDSGTEAGTEAESKAKAEVETKVEAEDIATAEMPAPPEVAKIVETPASSEVAVPSEVPVAQEPAVEIVAAKTPVAKKVAAAKKSAPAKKVATKKPAAKKVAPVKKPAAKKPAVKKPAIKKPAAKKPTTKAKKA